MGPTDILPTCIVVNIGWGFDWKTSVWHFPQNGYFFKTLTARTVLVLQNMDYSLIFTLKIHWKHGYTARLYSFRARLYARNSQRCYCIEANATMHSSHVFFAISTSFVSIWLYPSLTQPSLESWIWLGEMFRSYSAETCAGKFPLVPMGVRVEGPACADPGSETPIGASGIWLSWLWQSVSTRKSTDQQNTWIAY